MSDTFFGVDSSLPALGAGKYESLEAECLTDDIEDEYDALNDETFGGDLIATDDWEDNHNKFSQLKEKSKEWNSPRNDGEFSVAISKLDNVQHKLFDPDDELEQSISQLLVLDDDELDDPAIVDVGKSKPVTIKNKSFFTISPPPPAIIESDNVGSPSTSTIWTSALRSEQKYPSLLQNLQTKLLPQVSTDLKSQDPSIVGVVRKDENPSVPSLPLMQTVEEIERQLLSSSPLPFGARTVEDIERELVPPNQSTMGHINGVVGPFGPRSRPMVNRSSTPMKIDRKSSPISNVPIELGMCASPTGFGISPMSPPLGTPPKLGLNAAPLLIPSYSRRFVPPQVGFPRPLIVGQMPRNQALLGQPLLFPSNLPPGRMSPPGMFGPRTRFTYPVQYVDPYQRIVPPVRHPLLGINQVRPQVVQRTRKQIPRPSESNGEIDEYANLMTAKEKEWLNKIQLLQLQTSNPYLDDYYYTTYLMKQKTLAKTDSSDEPKLVLPELTKTETRIYTPEQYEGSLGKLQAVSVNYPRKIIDLDSMHPDDNDGESTVANKELRKFRQILLEIEKLYSIYLTIDETDKKIAALPKESHEPHEENKKTALLSIFNSLASAMAAEDKFIQIMGIRKGWNLILRCFPLFTKSQRNLILISILKSWTQIVKRMNNDMGLMNYLKYFIDMISTSEMDQLIIYGKYLQCENNLLNRSHFVSACQSKVGLTIICQMFNRSEQIFKEKETELKEELKENWSKIILHFCDVILSIPEQTIPKVNDVTLFLTHFHRFSIDELKLIDVENKLKLAFQTERKIR